MGFYACGMGTTEPHLIEGGSEEAGTESSAGYGWMGSQSFGFGICRAASDDNDGAPPELRAGGGMEGERSQRDGVCRLAMSRRDIVVSHWPIRMSRVTCCEGCTADGV